jgi:hypothetical protein
MSESYIGRIFLFLGLSILTLLFSLQAFSADILIMNAKRNIQLAEDDQIYKDYYLNAGAQAGIKKNTLLNVYRKQIIFDSTGTQNLGELKTLVGQLKVIAVDQNIAVARETTLASRDAEPMLDQIGIMIGDSAEISTAPIDNKKASVKKSQ